MCKPESPHAFPLFVNYGPKDSGYEPGMSLLDYFAGQSLITGQDEGCDIKAVAESCYKVAEAMLQERQKRNKK